MFIAAKEPKSCKELLLEYEKNKNCSNAKKIMFDNVGEADVYNVTAPFIDNGIKVLAGRVEDRDSEISKTRIFVEGENKWEASFPDKIFNRLQDPFFTKINGEIILGGVQIDTDPLDDERIICWRTLFYKGRSIEDLKLFASGPNRMKDIRLVGLEDGSIGIFTRPQGGSAGMGKIGYINVPSLEDVNEENILKARVYDSHFIDGEWGGVNEPHLLKNGLIGILGHIAYWEDRSIRHYHAMAFAFDPKTLEHTQVKIIARRADMAEGSFKREDIRDVLFSGGLVRLGNGRAVLYTGVSDSEAHEIEIDDPFVEFE